MMDKLQRENEDVEEIKDIHYDESDDGSFLNSNSEIISWKDSNEKKESISQKEFTSYVTHKIN